MGEKKIEKGKERELRKLFFKERRLFQKNDISPRLGETFKSPGLFSLS
jgi:hypothetical protein